MKLQQRMPVASAMLAASGTMILAFCEGSYVVMALAVVVSFGALVFCDLRGRFQLTTFTSNLAALAALAAAFWRLKILNPDEQVLAVADLMSYLQFILQCKPKVPRIYWLIAVVSFLQVSVGAALYTGLFAAVLLLGYLFCGIYFLAVFYLYREQLRFANSALVAESKTVKRGSGFYARTVETNVGADWSRDFSRRVIDLGLATVLLSAAIFVAVPRIGQTQWVPASLVTQRAVGFSPEINLNGSGTAIEDPEVVFNVQFFDAPTGEPYQIDGETYFRGTSVSSYEGGRWRRSNVFSSSTDLTEVSSDFDTQGMVRQRITIEPLSSTTLFSVSPAFGEESTPRIYINSRNARLDRREGDRGRRFSYDLLTTAFRRHRQTDLIPLVDPLGRNESLLALPAIGENGDPLSRLKAAAAAVVADIPAEQTYRRAKALESYLRDSGRFQHTLTAPERPADVDPLEDFVANNPRGHCEFFAGALALMLRSVGIPARVVLGYHGGDWNVVGNFYQVRQLNAHSWVEAYLPTEAVPVERLDRREMSIWMDGYRSDSPLDQRTAPLTDLRKAALPNGAWLQLDATTSNESVAAGLAGSRWGELKQVLDYLKFVWNGYVVGLDAETQRDSIYKPIQTWWDATVETVSDPQRWVVLRNAVDRLTPWRNLPGLRRLGAFGSWLLIALTIGCAILGWIVYRRRRNRRRGTVRRTTNGRRHDAEPVEFFVRLEALLAKLKLARSGDQTQREFVQTACGALAELPATRHVAQTPRKIVEAFYRVRFGSQSLEAGDRTEIESALAELDAALSQKRA